MGTQRIRGPLLSIAAVAVTGTGLWLVNTAAQPDSGPVVVSAPAAVTSVLAPPAAPPPAFPRAAQYSGQIVTADAPIVVDLTVAGATARAYVCDGYAIETWLSGPVTGDTVTLSSADGSGRLTGRLRSGAVVGTFTLGARSWEFTAAEVTDAQ